MNEGYPKNTKNVYYRKGVSAKELTESFQTAILVKKATAQGPMWIPSNLTKLANKHKETRLPLKRSKNVSFYKAIKGFYKKKHS